MKTKFPFRLWNLANAEENLFILSKEELYIFQLFAAQYYSA